MILKRLFEDLFGTHGELFNDDGSPLGVYTIEEPWKDNQQNISCIPPNENEGYRCTEYKSTHLKGHLYRLHDVPGREDVLIHGGNTIKDTRGCILVGLVKRKDGVGSSQDALAWLESHTPKEFRLRIFGVPKNEVNHKKESFND